MTSKPRSKNSKSLRKKSPLLFLDLYYPFHYKTGSAIEHALRGANLTQVQTVILWTIHSEGEDGEAMRRKDIETRITSWFDVTSSALSKSLRSMARSGLVEISEDPQSGREKRVRLTDSGNEYISGMKNRTEALIANIVAKLNDDEIQEGLNFLRRVNEIVEEIGDG